MDNFNALTNCVNGTVFPTGSPTTASLAIFSGPNSITGGNLSGDCTTTGAAAVTCTKTSGSPFGYFATGTDAGQLTGTIAVNRFGNGVNADAAHFLRGDGVWAQPPAGSGGGGGGSIPTLRGTSRATASAASLSLALPTGITAGDDCYLFVSAGSVPSPPSSWALISPQTGYGQNAFIAHKTLDSSDVTAGSVTISVNVGFRMQAMAACFVGAANHVSWVDNRSLANGLGPPWLQNKKWASHYIHAGETVFIFLANRASSSNTSSVGTLLQSDVEGDGSAQLYNFTPSSEGAIETSINFPSIGSYDLMLFMIGITQ